MNAVRRVVVVAWLGLALAGAARANPPTLELAATAPVIEVLDPSGSIDAAAVQGALDKLAPALARCATDATWSGDALAWIVVDWHGKVTKLELAVDKPVVEPCLVGELRKLVISRAHGWATVMLRLRFGPVLVSGKRPASEPPEPPPPVRRGEVRATRIAPGPRFTDPARVRDAVRQQLQDVTVCYERALEAKPRLAGPAIIELTVAASGAIDSAAVGSAPGNLADCVKRAMLRIRLPAPAAVEKLRLELQLGPTG